MKYSVLLLSSLAIAPAMAEVPVQSSVHQDHVSEQLNNKKSHCEWALWDSFKQNYIQNGRVIDDSDPRNITTSEGQSYGLFFALIANDKETFDQLLNWTEDNLAGGDLTARLPSWLWGTVENGEQKILDVNTASDSDLWIAYSLMEAGRIWNNYYYKTLGHLLSLRILKEETKKVDGVGTVLLPGRQGFVLNHDHVRFNPSYVPMQIIARMKAENPDYQWQEIEETSNRLILESMPKGFSPDWIEVTAKGVKSDEAEGNIGNYDAIRTYLWAGMLSEDSPYKKALVDKMQPLVEVLKSTQRIPESFDAQTGQYFGYSNLGLNASVIPLLKAAGQQQLAQIFEQKVKQGMGEVKAHNYYQNVLILFSQGWSDGRYTFDKTGKVMPNWHEACR